MPKLDFKAILKAYPDVVILLMTIQVHLKADGTNLLLWFNLR